jgi:RNA polymerase sigma-70 factor (ECF subfamily)
MPSLEETLCTRLLTGEPNAVAELFAHYRPRLRQMVRLRIGRELAARIDPSDVLQDAFVDALQKVRAYVSAPQVPPFVWLRRLTWDRLIKLQRTHVGTQKRNLERQVSLPEETSVALVQQLFSPDTGPIDLLLRAELHDQMERSIAQLSDADREVILMRHYEGLSNNQVAQTLCISVSGATMRHGRALIRMRKLLQHVLPSEPTDG